MRLHLAAFFMLSGKKLTKKHSHLGVGEDIMPNLNDFKVWTLTYLM